MEKEKVLIDYSVIMGMLKSKGVTDTSLRGNGTLHGTMSISTLQRMRSKQSITIASLTAVSDFLGLRGIAIEKTEKGFEAVPLDADGA